MFGVILANGGSRGALSADFVEKRCTELDGLQAFGPVDLLTAAPAAGVSGERQVDVGLVGRVRRRRQHGSAMHSDLARAIPAIRQVKSPAGSCYSACGRAASTALGASGSSVRGRTHRIVDVDVARSRYRADQGAGDVVVGAGVAGVMRLRRTDDPRATLQQAEGRLCFTAPPARTEPGSRPPWS